MKEKESGRFITRLFPWVVLCVSVMLAAYVPFSHWAVNAVRFGAHDAGLALFFSLSKPFAVYVSMGIALLSLILGGIYRAMRRPGGNIQLLAGLTGMLPLVWLALLELAG
jgi:hypothetical protein